MSYRGEVSFKFKRTVILDDGSGKPPYIEYEVGERIGQIIIIPFPKIEFVEVDELSETERGANGYGSTGR